MRSRENTDFILLSKFCRASLSSQFTDPFFFTVIIKFELIFSPSCTSGTSLKIEFDMMQKELLILLFSIYFSFSNKTNFKFLYFSQSKFQPKCVFFYIIIQLFYPFKYGVFLNIYAKFYTNLLFIHNLHCCCCF